MAAQLGLLCAAIVVALRGGHSRGTILLSWGAKAIYGNGRQQLELQAATNSKQAQVHPLGIHV